MKEVRGIRKITGDIIPADDIDIFNTVPINDRWDVDKSGKVVSTDVIETRHNVDIFWALPQLP